MAGTERLEEDQSIRVVSWRAPGKLDITLGVNGTAETYAASFSDGLDPRFSSLDTSQLLRLVDAVRSHQAELLQGEEPSGARRLRLCQYTEEELTGIIDSRKSTL